MAKKPKKPIYTHVKVNESNQARAPWRVWYAVESEGKQKRVFKSFASEAAAHSFAEDKDREISNHGVRYGDIPPELRRAFDFYRDESADLITKGAEVPRFEDLIFRSLAEIRAQLQLATDADLRIAEAVAEFLAYKMSRVKERQLANLTDQLKRFTTDYGDKPISTVTAPQIEKWLSSLRSRRNPDKLRQAPFLSPLSRNHYRATLHGFFEYASAPARGLCQRNPLAHLEPERVPESKPKAYTPEDAARIMQTALNHKPELLPVLALGMFAGMRASETEVFDLSQLTPTTIEFRVDSNKSGGRIVPFSDACKAWMFAQPRRKGAACITSPRTKIDEIAELFKLAQVKQLRNGARDSYISYRCAEIRDVARVADEVGNSPSTIRKHYREIVTAAAAAKYFAIRPEAAAENVTGIEAGRASA